jgi:signal transduction histidine kinase/Tfp pilus assembly protein PilF
MLFKMGLFTERVPRSGDGLWIILIVCIFSCFLSSIFRSDQKTPSPSNAIESLFLKADSSLGSAPGFADSILKQALALSLIEKEPRHIVKSWMMLGKIQHVKGENEKAIDFFTKAIELAREKSLFKEWCEAKISIGEIIYGNGGYDSALSYFTQAEKIAELNHLETVKSYALFFMGKCNETKGNFEQAKEYYQHAIELCRKNKDYAQLAEILPSRGKNYLSEGKLNLALECYMEALQLCEQLNDRLLYAETSSHLAGLYLQMGMYEKALEFDKKALAFRNLMKNPDGIAKSYNNIGKAYVELNKPDSAFFYFNQSLAFCEKINYKKGTVKALTNMGRMYSEQNNLNKSMEFLTRAFNLSKQSGYDMGVAESSLALGNLYRKTHQTSKAIDFYQLSLAKVEKTNYDEIMEGIYDGLFQCYRSVGDYRSALQNHLLLLDVEKRLLNVENKRQLALLNISFDVERKDKDNLVLRTDNELKEVLINRKNALMWLVFVALGFTIAFCLIIYHRLYAKKKANRLLKDLNHKILNQNNELALLNGELEKANHEKDKLFAIISHELRNPLYWFQNLAEVLSKKHKEMPADKVQKSLSALDESAKNAFHLTDNLLQWSRSKLNRVHPKRAVHNLHDLVGDTSDMYQTILRHKELNFCNRISKELEVYGDSDLMGCVIRNLLTNAIKYTPPRGTVSIESRNSEKLVTVVVSDSGTGIPESNIQMVFDENMVSVPGLSEERGSGLGLKLCKDFVELNGGRIWVKSAAHSGTQIFFTIPRFLSPAQAKSFELAERV